VGDAMFDLYGATTSKRHTLQAEAGVNLGVLKGLTLAPRASLGYASYKFGGYRETGGEAALQLDDLAIRQFEGRLGAKLTGSARIAGGWTFVPQLQGDLVHQLAGSKDGLRVRFANVADHLFTLPLANGDANWAEVKGGFKLSKGTKEFGAGIEKSVGRTDYTDERAMAVFKLGF
jgi:outer membrane autotransporter protein